MQWARTLLCFGLLALSATQVLAVEKVLTAAIAVMSGTTDGSAISGTATFNKTAQGIAVQYNVCGLLASTSYLHHVHVAGNIVDNNGAAALGHFIGSCATSPNCRGNGVLAEIGNLYNGVAVTSNANGCVTTGFTDTFITLNGADSIIGRSLIFHLASTGVRVAHGVIGRWNTAAEETAASTTADGPVITRAICALQPTASFANGFLDGFVSFQDRGTGSIEVRYFVYGLGDQQRYTVGIAQTGNIADTSAGLAAQSEFVGTCNNCRPGSVAAVGNLGGDGLRFITISNVAQGFFTDSVIRLNGTNSIVGRALQLFDPNNPAVCVAQCTIGIDQPESLVYTNDPSGLGTVPQVVRAAAVIQPAAPINVTSNYKPPPPASEVDTEVVFRGISRYAVTSFLGSTGTLPAGYVEFTMLPGSTNTTVRYFLSGLPASSTHIIRVHANGDTCDTRGMSVGDTLSGSCSNCRPTLANDQQLVGLIGNNLAVTANAYGIAKGQFVDGVVKLNGVNSIVGRSIVVHGNGTVDDLTVIGMGVVGRLESHRTNVDEDLPTIYNAGCSFESTLDSANPQIQGYASFALDADGFVVTKIYVAGLVPGNHGFHVHTQGDVLDYWHAGSVLGHFNTSNLTYPRPFGQLQEVGLLNDGAALVADAKGVAFTTFKDRNIALNGLNGIVGRSLVIHGNGTNNDIRVAQCVIGATRDSLAVSAPSCATLNDDLFPPSTTSAHCQFSPTASNPNPALSGWMTFTNNWPSPGLFYSWSICGLEPGIHPFHVHHRGEIFSDDGTSTLDHFIGPCTSCRRYNPQEVGNVNSGMFPLVVDVDGCTSGSNNDTLITLNGPNSILGRSIVIHGRVTSTSSVTFTTNSTRVAQCVIGRADSPVTEAAAALAPRQPTVRRASCNLVATSIQTTPVQGFITFEYSNPQMIETSPVEVKYYIVGLADNDYAFHVHQYGNISDSVAGLATGGHYNGSCQYCRPAGVLQEVGLLGDGTKIRSRNGVASGFFTDSVIKLNGRRSILGRSIIVHRPSDSARILQCVIGVVDDGFFVAPRNYSQTITFDVDGQPVISPTSANPTVPTVTRAVAVLANTSQIEGRIAGYVEFELERVSNIYSVKYLITGLQPSTPRSWAIYTKGDLCQNDGRATGTVVRMLKTIQVDANGVAKGNFSDSGISFNDTTTILGRAVIIYDNTNSVPIAQGVIGRAKEDNVTLVVDRSPVYTASCRPVATGLNPNPVDGYFLFQADDVYSVVRVWYTLWGLQPGKHGIFVHQFGDVSADDAAGATGGYFVGNITTALPPGIPQVVGALNNGSGFIATSGASGEPFGYAQGSFFDFNLALSGPNSILGRSIVIYGDDWNGNTNKRVAQCVIGLSNELVSSNRTTCPSLSADDPPAATCYLTATKQNPASISSQFFGYVSITQVSPSLHRIEYQYCGLSDLNPHYFSIRNRGDISNSDGSSAGTFFGPCNNCRGHGATDFIGNMDNFVFTNNGSQYCGTGVFYDTQIALTGSNSVIARTLFIHGSDTSASAPVAQCVIGRNDYASVDTIVPGYNVTRAIAVMIPTALAPSFGGGIVTFDYEGDQLFQKADGTGLATFPNYGVRFFLFGLPLQAHTFHIHHKGNLLDPLGNGSEGHFFGVCNTCRPEGVEQAIGRLGDGYDMQAQNGVASGYMNDHIVTLNGLNSIMGRAMVIHGDGRNLLPRVQQSVLGVLQDTNDAAPSAPPTGPLPQVTRAAAIITATANANTIVLGNVEFLVIPGSANLAVTAMITGLEPGVSHSWALVKSGDLCSSSGTQTVTNFLPINGGAKLNADINGVAHASFQESTMRFYGTNSIIGRSLVVYGNLTTGGTGIIGQGVIGKISESAAVTQPDHPTVYTASCRLTPTFIISPAAQPIDIAGYVYLTADNSTGAVTIQWQATNLPVGTHQWYVHQRGDVISADNGLATGSTFKPLCGGELLKVDDFGIATGKCTDSAISLNGANSILGRSIVIWGDGTPIGSVKRIAQCVVGVVDETTTAPATCPLLDAIARPSEDSGMSTATLAGIIVGSVVGGLVLIGAVAFLVMRRQSSSTPYKTGDKLAPENAPVELATAVYKSPSSTTPTAAAVPIAKPSRPAPLPPGANTTSPALPPNWEQHEDDEGNTYYYNTLTKQSVWELPRA